VGVGLLGLALSLDEMTALHENLLWLEVRQVSARLGGAWVYATQWQVLFSPAILLALAYLVLFFANRLGANAGARRCASAGIALWIGALCLEGMRGAFRLSGGEWYDLEVLVEEESGDARECVSGRSDHPPRAGPRLGLLRRPEGATARCLRLRQQTIPDSADGGGCRLFPLCRRALPLRQAAGNNAGAGARAVPQDEAI